MIKKLLFSATFMSAFLILKAQNIDKCATMPAYHLQLQNAQSKSMLVQADLLAKN